VKVTANTVSPGTALPTAGPTAATEATTAPVTSASTGQPPAGGSHSVARALLSANRHRADRPRTSASSAVIAVPHARRRSGNAATAAASNRPGGSIVDIRDQVLDRQWRSTNRAVSSAAEPNCSSATHSSGGTTSCTTAVTGPGSSSAFARATA